MAVMSHREPQLVKKKSELSDYQTRLKSVTGGQGSYSIDFSHYAPVPPHTQAQLVSKHKQPVEEEQ